MSAYLGQLLMTHGGTYTYGYRWENKQELGKANYVNKLQGRQLFKINIYYLCSLQLIFKETMIAFPA